MGIAVELAQWELEFGWRKTSQNLDSELAKFTIPTGFKSGFYDIG